MRLRPTGAADLPFVTSLERHEENRELIGQWTDPEHLDAIAGKRNREHRIIERDGAPAGYVIAYDGRGASPSMYIKRVLIADKERGTGKAAIAMLLDDCFARDGVDFAWLLVRQRNDRAQAAYRKLGFTRYDPTAEEAEALERYAEAPGPESFRMRIDRATWHGRRA